MKKITLLVAMIIAVTLQSSAQGGNVTDTCPCVKAQPVKVSDERIKPVKKSPVYRPPSGPSVVNSHNMTNSHNVTFNIHPAPQPAHDHVYDHRWYSDYSGLFFLLLLLLGTAAVIAVLRTRPAPAAPASPGPPASPAPTTYRTPVKPAVDLLKVHENLKGSGASLSIYPDGGMKVQYPKDTEQKG